MNAAQEMLSLELCAGEVARACTELRKACSVPLSDVTRDELVRALRTVAEVAADLAVKAAGSADRLSR